MPDNVTPKYKTILTELGKAMVADSIRGKSPVYITEMAFGTGDYTPLPGQTALSEEKARVPVHSITADKDNPAWVRAMAVIPPDVGGFRIFEVGLFADNGNLFAVGKLDGTYKPVYNDGMVKEIAVDMILEVSEQAEIELKVDPHLILATREWVEEYFGARIESLGELTQTKVSKTFSINTVAPLKGGGQFTGEYLTFTVDRATTIGLGVTRLATVAEHLTGTSEDTAATPKGVMALVTKMCAAVEAKIEKLSFAGLTKIWPAEIPLPWRGAPEKVPSGWQILAGMEGRAVIGAGGKFALNSTGGAETHEHTVTGSISSTSHSHGVSGTVGDTTLSTLQIPSHYHSVRLFGAGSGGSRLDDGSGWHCYWGIGKTESAGGSASHTHSLAGASTESNSHSHNFSTGKSSSVSNRDPYVAWYWIIKKA